MILKKYQLKYILDFMRSYCNRQQCTKCPFSDKEPDPENDWKVTYWCKLKSNNRDPWEWPDESEIQIQE